MRDLFQLKMPRSRLAQERKRNFSCINCTGKTNMLPCVHFEVKCLKIIKRRTCQLRMGSRFGKDMRIKGICHEVLSYCGDLESIYIKLRLNLCNLHDKLV